MMNDKIQYISFEEVMDVYQKTIDNSGGGFAGVRDESGIHSVIEFMQDDIYYPTFVSKITYLVFGFCSGHYFNDGNKRIALTLGTYFLHKNKYYWVACLFMRQVEAIVYHIAASHIDKDLLERIMQCVVDGTDYDEALKIDIANAMSQGELGLHEKD
jgi:death-on-curing protein